MAGVSLDKFLCTSPERIGSSKSDMRRQIVRALETIEAALEAYK